MWQIVLGGDERARPARLDGPQAGEHARFTRGTARAMESAVAVPTGASPCLVVLRDPGADAAAATPRLADVLGIAPYDARRRLQGSGPRLVATFADPGSAQQVVEGLRRAGFAALMVPLARATQPVVAHGFALEPTGLRVLPRQGPAVVLAYDRVRLLVRGTRIVSETRTEKTRERRFSLGRTVLSGGLVVTKTTTSERARTVEEREGFLVVCSAHAPEVLFLETDLLYEGFGADRQPTRAANFARLTTLLRDAAPGARVDDRLLTRASQAAVLGGLLEPEAHLDTAVEVVKQAALGE